MEFQDFFGHKISRMGIGTVQFGMNYGVNNSSGQTSMEDIATVFEKCRERGISFVDTSRCYGSSEARIAATLDRLNARKDFFIETKLDLPGDWETMSEKELLMAARRSLEQSLRTLRVESIPLYLLHTERYLKFPCLWEFMLRQIEDGTVQRIGVSLEIGPSGAEACFGLPQLAALQIPFNALDSRWDAAGFFRRTLEKGILVVGRSTYLQGLLLMSPDSLPENLHYVAVFLSRLATIAAEAGMDRKTLCLRYALSRTEIGTSILGLDSAAQFDENFGIYSRGPLDEELLGLVSGAFSDVPEHCVNPSLWKVPRM